MNRHLISKDRASPTLVRIAFEFNVLSGWMGARDGRAAAGFLPPGKICRSRPAKGERAIASLGSGIY
jgi:hypothetical protein